MPLPIIMDPTTVEAGHLSFHDQTPCSQDTDPSAGEANSWFLGTVTQGMSPLVRDNPLRGDPFLSVTKPPLPFPGHVFIGSPSQQDEPYEIENIVSDVTMDHLTTYESMPHPELTVPPAWPEQDATTSTSGTRRTEREWAVYQAKIQNFYMERNLTLTSTMKFMKEEHGFTAS
ncbi:hypothetical protein MMC28_007085 [Mycoblastus sanguinarius]|nr:hypothetical protein [Mycoblastus sanguinarius]